MKRTLFNYQLNLEQHDYTKMANMVTAYKEGRLSYEQLNLDINESFKTFFYKDSEFHQILEVAKSNHVLFHLVSQSNEVLELPWQLFLDQFPLIGLSKGNAPINEIYPTRLNSRLKVLIILSSPVDAEPLDLERETQSLLSGFMNYEIDVDITADGSLKSLTHSLKQKDYDILYFSGHGVYRNGKTILFFESPILAKEVDVTGKEFVDTILETCNTLPQLVILSSCYSGKGAIRFEGVTNLLLQNQIPAVVSFSDAVEQYSAAEFCGNMASQLTKRYDIVDAFKFSINTLKKGALKEKNWLIPQLYLNKHIEKLVSFEIASTTDLNAVNCLIEKNNYKPFLHKKEISQLGNALANGKVKINISGHRGVGKSSIVNYTLQQTMQLLPSFKIIELVGANCTLQHLTEKLVELGGTQTGNIVKDLAEFATRFPLTIVIDGIDKYVKLDNGIVKVEFEILEIISQIKEINLIVVTRLTLIDHEFEIMRIGDITVPQLFFLFNNTYLGSYIKEKYPRYQTSNILDNNSLYLFIKELFFRYNYGGILELYMLFEFFLKKFTPEKDSYESFNDLINTNIGLIDKALIIYENDIEENYGYNIFKHLKELDENSQKILKTLSYYSMQVKKELLRNEIIDDEVFDTIFERLIQLNFINGNKQNFARGLYTLHPLILYFSRKLEVESYYDKLKAASYFENIFNHKLDDHRFMNENIVTYRDHLTSAFEIYSELNHHDKINTVGQKLCTLYYNLNSFDESLQVGLQIFNLLKQQTAVAVVEHIIDIYSRRGDYRNAEKFHELFNTTPIEKEQGMEDIYALKQKADQLFTVGQFKKSSEMFDNALRMLDAKVTPTKEIKQLRIAILSDSANSFRRLGEHKKVEEGLLEALANSKELKQNFSPISDNLSALYHELGNTEKALHYAEETLIESKKYLDYYFEISTLEKQAQYYLEKHRFENAKLLLQQVLLLVKRLSDKVQEANAYKKLGNVFLVQGEFKQEKGLNPESYYKNTLEFFEKADQSYNKNGFITQHYDLYNMMASVLNKLGDFDKGIRIREKQLALAKEMDNILYELQTLGAMAFDAKRREDNSKAIKYYNMLLELIDNQLEEISITDDLKHQLLQEKIAGLLQLANIFDKLEFYEPYLEKCEYAFKLFFESKIKLNYYKERTVFFSALTFLSKDLKSNYTIELENMVETLKGKYLN
jgi:tetratricopeptide (TPR) repeat protein